MLGRSRAARRRIVVAAILACGWIAAAAIYVAAPAPQDEDPDVYEMRHSREYERQVEVLGGKGALLADDLTRWLASLWQGRTLAYPVALLTAAAAAGWYAWDRLGASAPDRDG